MDRFSNIVPENLTGIYKDIAEAVGVENAYKIFLILKGQQQIFPVKFFSNEYIAEQIIKEYDGTNVHDLVRKFEYSESRIRQIIRKQNAKKII